MPGWFRPCSAGHCGGTVFAAQVAEIPTAILNTSIMLLLLLIVLLLLPPLLLLIVLPLFLLLLLIVLLLFLLLLLIVLLLFLPVLLLLLLPLLLLLLQTPSTGLHFATSLLQGGRCRKAMLGVCYFYCYYCTTAATTTTTTTTTSTAGAAVPFVAFNVAVAVEMLKRVALSLLWGLYIHVIYTTVGTEGRC